VSGNIRSKRSPAPVRADAARQANPGLGSSARRFSACRATTPGSGWPEHLERVYVPTAHNRLPPQLIALFRKHRWPGRQARSGALALARRRLGVRRARAAARWTRTPTTTSGRTCS